MSDIIKKPRKPYTPRKHICTDCEKVYSEIKKPRIYKKKSKKNVKELRPCADCEELYCDTWICIHPDAKRNRKKRQKKSDNNHSVNDDNEIVKQGRTKKVLEISPSHFKVSIII